MSWPIVNLTALVVSTLEWIVALAGLTATVTVWSLFVFHRGRSAHGGEPAQVRRIRIDGRYQPSEVHVSAGEPTRLIFRREETAPCSERVVFPDYGISVMLPAFEDVTVDLPASEPGEHEFTCQMEMLHGRLIVGRRRSGGEAGSKATATTALGTDVRSPAHPSGADRSRP